MCSIESVTCRTCSACLCTSPVHTLALLSNRLCPVRLQQLAVFTSDPWCQYWQALSQQKFDVRVRLNAVHLVLRCCRSKQVDKERQLFVRFICRTGRESGRWQQSSIKQRCRVTGKLCPRWCEGEKKKVTFFWLFIIERWKTEMMLEDEINISFVFTSEKKICKQ